MFATILRRWRLVTPLVLAVLAISIVSSGMLMPTSAAGTKFHFFGRAYALADIYGLPDVACDTGFLAVSGSQSLDTGHCFGAAGFGVPGNAITGTGRLDTIFAEDTVVSSHGARKGKVVATADVEGQVGASLISLQEGSAACPVGNSGGGNNNFPTGCDSDSNNSTCCPVGGNQLQVNALEFVATHITEVAVASCNTHLNGTTQATVGAATTNMVNPAVTENRRERFIGPNGLPNQAFTISGFTDEEGGNLSILVVLNEQKPFVDGDLGAISANAVHIFGTDTNGKLLFDWTIDHVFAGIHCAKHLGTDQNIGTLVGD